MELAVARASSANRSALNVLARLVLLILALTVILQLLHSPFATNDGPIHVAFAEFIATHGAADVPLKNKAYVLDLRPTPNLISYFVLVPAIKLLSAQAAEALLQALCILGPVLAGWFAIRTLNANNEFLALALFPFALNQMFFLGLYNYSLSIAGFFLAIALYLRLEASPSVGRAAALAGGLLLAFFCHAAGFIMAVAGVGSMACARIAVRRARGQSFRALLWGQRHLVFSLLAPLPVCILFLSATAGAPILFGSDVFSRIDQFIHLTALDVSSDITRYAARGLRSALACGLIGAIGFLLMKRSEMSPSRFEQSMAIIAAGLTATLIMLFLPDTIGGGWTHFKRMVVFPYFWVVLLLACMPISRTAGIAALAAGTVASVALLTAATGAQSTIEHQMSPLAEVDRRVGPHCSIAPVVLESRPVDAAGQPLPLEFAPYFQAASRLELKDDRVVLFNFLARLDVYPVRFKPEVEPQQHLFGWKPYQHDVRTRQIDIANYERISGMPVDYLLVWGKSSGPDSLIRRQVAEEALRSTLVYRSDDGWVALYRRPTANTLCH